MDNNSQTNLVEWGLSDNITASTGFDDTVFTKPTPSAAMKVLVTVVPITTVVTNLPSVILIVVLIFTKKMVKNFHLLSLGITDALVGISSYLMAETYIATTSQFSYYNCWFRYYLFSISFVASMLHVLGICIIRVRSTHLHFQGHNQGSVQWTIIIMSWIISLLLHTVPYVIWAKRYTLTECSLDALFYGHEHEYMYYTGTCFAAVEILVVTSMCVLLKILWIRRRKFPDESWSTKDVKLCATVAVLAFLFITCTLPLTIVLLCYDYLGIYRRTTRTICALFALFNSAMNPVIYILKIKEFRDVMKENRFCCKRNEIAPYNAGEELAKPCQSNQIELSRYSAA